MKTIQLLLIIVFTFGGTLLSQDQFYLKLDKTKTGPLISSQYPQAGAIVLTSEVGELEFSSQPEPVDTRIRKEGKGKATKYNYTLFFEAETPIELTIVPRNGNFEDYQFSFQVDKKIGQYYTVRLSKEMQAGQIARADRSEVEPKADDSKAVAAETEQISTEPLVLQEYLDETLQDLRTGYGGIVITSLIEGTFSITSSIEDGIYGDPLVSDNGKKFTYFFIPNSAPHILTFSAKGYLSGKREVMIVPNKMKSFRLGTRTMINKVLDDERKRLQEEEQRKRAQLLAEAENRRIDSIRTAIADSIRVAQQKPQSEKKSEQKIEQKKGGSVWPFLLFIAILGGGGYYIYENVIKERKD